MLRAGVDGPVVVVVAEIPRLARVDRQAAAWAHRTADDLELHAPPQVLVPPAIATKGRAGSLHSVHFELGCARSGSLVAECPIPQKRLNQAVSAGFVPRSCTRLIADDDVVVYCPECDKREFDAEA